MQSDFEKYHTKKVATQWKQCNAVSGLKHFWHYISDALGRMILR